MATGAMAASEWLDDAQTPPGPPRQRIHLSDEARREANKEMMQSFPEDDWDADKKARPQQQRPQIQQQPQTDDPSQYQPQMQSDDLPQTQTQFRSQQEAAAAMPARKPIALQGGVTSSVRNFGKPDDPEMLGLGKEARQMMMNLYTTDRLPFPDPKTVSPTLYKSWLKTAHPELGATDKEAIVEVKGQWDDSGHILHYFGWLSTRLNSNVVSKFDFSHTDVVIVDCAGNLNQDAIEALRTFVWNGGYLVSTDWTLDNFVVKAFPGAIEWNGGYSYPGIDDAVVVEQNPDYLKDYFQNCVPHARWKLDDKCQTVKVRKSQYVHVLVRSVMLSREDPDNNGVLAATFQYGKGQVLHVVGHFDINSAGTFTNSLPDPAPRIGIGLRQALIANFIVKGLETHAAVAAPGKSDPKDSDAADK